MTLTELCSRLPVTPVVAATNDPTLTGCYVGDLLSWVMARGQEDQLWLTIMGNINVIAVAKLVGFAAVILCEDAPLDDNAKQQATASGIPIYKTALPMFELSVQIGKLLDL